MRKILLILVIIGLFVSCDLDPYFYNKAIYYSLSETVYVEFYNGDNIYILPGESMEIKLLKTSGNSGISNYEPNFKVSCRYINGTFEFWDIKSYEIKIINISGKNGILSGNNMNNISFSSDSSEQSNSSWLLFNNYHISINSLNLKATSNEGYILPIIIQIEDKTIKVTIHN